MQKYIDFFHNEELKKEVSHMSGLGMSILEEGREEGREEANIASAQKMLLGNMQISLIMEITSLSREKIEGIKKEMIENGQLEEEKEE